MSAVLILLAQILYVTFLYSFYVFYISFEPVNLSAANTGFNEQV